MIYDVKRKVFNISVLILTHSICILNLIVLSGLCCANTLYPFENKHKEQHFYNYIGHIRCLVCQNESIKDSNAPLATQLREHIYEQMSAGKSDEDIDIFLKNRYGEFINYAPENNALTFLLWIIPGLMFFYLVYVVLAPKRQSSPL